MDEMRMVFDHVGSPTFAGDLAEVLLKIISESSEKREKFVPEIYNYSNEGVASWYDFACEIVLLKGLKAIVHPIETFEYPLPAPRPQYSVLNKRKIKRYILNSNSTLERFA